MTREELLTAFRKKARAIRKAKATARYAHVVGRLKRAKLLDVPDVPEYGGPVDLEDAIWAGKIEPRILEVLPALLVTHPKFFRTYRIPEDLSRAIDGMRRGNVQISFRGISPEDYCRWLPQSYRAKTKLKTFRMSTDEINLLKSVREKLRVNSDTEVVRRALELLSKSIINE